MYRHSKLLVTTLLLAAGLAGCQSMLTVRPIAFFPPAGIASDIDNDDWRLSQTNGKGDSLNAWTIREEPEHALQRERFEFQFNPKLLIESKDEIEEYRSSPTYSGITDNTLPGWNAALLLAETDEPVPPALLATLERITTKPLRYNPTTQWAAGTVTSGVSEWTENSLASLKSHFKSDNDSGDSQKDATDHQGVIFQEISETMRAAAAERWCRSLIKTDPQNPEEALAPAGRALLQDELPPLVRYELYYGLARSIPPARIPGLSEAFRDPLTADRAPVEDRRAAIQACLIYAVAVYAKSQQRAEITGSTSNLEYDEFHWPSTIWNCSLDPDPHVRQMFGRWLAISNSPRQLELLTAQLQDREQSVRAEAMTSLGLLGSDEALHLLRQQSERSEMVVRQQALRGLGFWGPDELANHVRDKSLHVRQTVAEELARYPEPTAALMIRDFLSDPASQVQNAALESIRKWPKDLKVPLLLHGLRDSCLAVRKNCQAELVQAAHVGEEFLVAADREYRVKAVEKIIRDADLPSVILTLNEDESPSNAAIANEIRRTEILEALEIVRQQNFGTPPYDEALQTLQAITEDDLTIVEHFLVDHPGPYQMVVLSEVLPKVSPVYEALAGLSSQHVDERRQAARKLAQHATQGSLSPQVASFLFERMRNEQDRHVWQSVMDAVMNDGTEQHAEVALLAINHTWPDIRMLGCEYVARHAQPEQAYWVLPLLEDENKNVQLAAIDAAGRCNNTTLVEGITHQDESRSFPGLRPLLTNTDQRVRMAAVVALCRLGDMKAMQELVRLTYSDNPKTREEAVRMMGETGRTRFVEQLIRTAWTERNNLVKRSILTSLNLLIPPDEAPHTAIAQQSYDDRIKAWVSWWEDRHRQADSANPNAASRTIVPSSGNALSER